MAHNRRIEANGALASWIFFPFWCHFLFLRSRLLSNGCVHPTYADVEMKLYDLTLSWITWNPFQLELFCCLYFQPLKCVYKAREVGIVMWVALLPDCDLYLLLVFVLYSSSAISFLLIALHAPRRTFVSLESGGRPSWAGLCTFYGF
jgi:hypothetical protein